MAKKKAITNPNKVQKLRSLETKVFKCGAKVKYAEYLCYCGDVFSTQETKVNTGHTKSCGCLQREVNKKRCTTHGLRNSKTYNSWVAMKNRCYGNAYHASHRYKGRGIVVCSSWKNSFENFLEDMGVRPKGKTLDRIDNNGNYEPNNCRWATIKEQCLNRY